MKKAIAPFLLIPFCCFGQKIVENKVDEFTKASVKRTSWELISKGTIKDPGIYAHVRISKINGSIEMDLRVIDGGGSVFAVQKDAEIMFKLDNDSVVTLKNREFKVTCSGCGASGYVGSESEGLELNFFLNEQEIDSFKSHSVRKIRIYTADGYIENVVNNKWKDVIKAELNLL